MSRSFAEERTTEVIVLPSKGLVTGRVRGEEAVAEAKLPLM